MSARAGTAVNEVNFAPLGSSKVARRLAVEAPVAFEFNGLAYAVMTATPADLAGFATGFALSEGLVQYAGEIDPIAVHEGTNGWIVRANPPPERAAPLLERAKAAGLTLVAPARSNTRLASDPHGMMKGCAHGL
jgi:formate dehydrogenase accessory protein FdhD